jgi:hypothetical protein
MLLPPDLIVLQIEQRGQRAAHDEQCDKNAYRPHPPGILAEARSRAFSGHSVPSVIHEFSLIIPQGMTFSQNAQN